MAVPYLGSKISLISNSECRYEGILYTIDAANSTVALQNVRSFGTEGRRPGEEIAAADQTFDFIIFRGSDIKDLAVVEQAQQAAVPQDPAIVSTAAPTGPPQGQQQPQQQQQQQQQQQYQQQQQQQYQQQQQQQYQQQQQQQQQPKAWGAPQQAGVAQRQNNGNQQRQQNNNNNRNQQQNNNNNNRNQNRNQQQQQQQQQQQNRRGKGKGGNQPRAPRPLPYAMKPAEGSAKLTFNEEFDFATANQGFNKVTEEVAADDAEAAAEDVETVAPIYNKNDSFFDNVSSVTSNLPPSRNNDGQGRSMAQQRSVDVETFGQESVTENRRRGNRRFRGGRGGYRGGNGGGNKRN